MLFRRLALVLLLALAVPVSAKAWGLDSDDTTQPNLISLGAGSFDPFRQIRPGDATDFRLEHRWGTSLLPTSNLDRYFQIHPFAGIETTEKAQLYGFGGFVFDVFVTEHVFLSPNLAVGLYESGTGKRLGSFVEFRSTFEAGWKFDNQVRVGGYIGHMSNAEICSWNPGAEMVGGYIHIPTGLIFGH